MFKKAKRKIVLSTLALLCALLIGTLGLIYLTSFLSVTSQNFAVLEQRANMFAGNPGDEPKSDPGEKIAMDGGRVNNGMRDRGRMERNLQIGTFYAVKFASGGETVVLENGADGIYTDEELIALAESVRSKEKGRTGELLYVVTTRNGEEIVSFMDNTVFTDSFSKLFGFTLLFGVMAIIAITFISVHIANRIVAPMEESYQKQKQFTADAGHELKTPIAAVSANAELLRREIGENQWLSNIESENERMKALVTELLELAKNENKTADKKPVDLSHLVAGTILPLEATAFEKGILLENHIENGIIVQADENGLGQLVTILVDNALSHAAPAGEEPVAVTVNLSSVKGNAVLTVSNPGAAIPEAERDKIFERFYRADDSHAFTGHYGLGLAIAKAIADQNDAKIAVSCPDGCVCFQVIFRHH